MIVALYTIVRCNGIAAGQGIEGGNTNHSVAGSDIFEDCNETKGLLEIETNRMSARCRGGYLVSKNIEGISVSRTSSV